MTAPVMDDGKVIGVLIAQLSIDEIDKSLAAKSEEAIKDEIAGRGGPRVHLDAAKRRAHAGHELARREGLGHVVVRADGQADDLVDLVVTGRHHDDIGVAERPELTADLDTVPVREREVQDDQFGALGPGPFQALLAPGRGDDGIPLLLQEAAHEQSDLRRVLDHEGRSPIRGHLVTPSPPCTDAPSPQGDINPLERRAHVDRAAPPA